jgi:hypothetical protein
MAGGHAWLVGIEIGFDRAVERGELGLDDTTPEKGAYPVQLNAGSPTCR